MTGFIRSVTQKTGELFYKARAQISRSDNPFEILSREYTAVKVFM